MPIFILILLSTAFLNESLRQLISISLFFIAFPYIKKERFLIFFIIILISMLFHISAILTLPIYFIYKYRVIRNLFFYISISFCVLNILNIDTLGFLVSFSNKLLPTHFSEKLLFYVSSSQSYISKGYIVRATTLLFLFLLFRRKIPNNSNLKFIWCGFLCLIGYEMLFHEITTLSTRMKEYFMIFFPLAIYEITNIIRNSKSVVFIGILLYSIYFFWISIVSSPLWPHYASPTNYIYSNDKTFSNKRDNEIIYYWNNWNNTFEAL